MLEAKIGVGYWLLLSILTFDAGLQPLPVQGPGHKKRVLKCRFQDFRPDGPNIKCQLEQIQYTTDSFHLISYVSYITEIKALSIVHIIHVKITEST